MKTTVDIPDLVYRQLKSKAAMEGTSVKEIILRGVQGELQLRKRRSGKRAHPPIIRSKKPRSLELDNAKIYEIISFP
jgi:hypothetical protein